MRVQNGTTAQGTACFQERKIYNWTRIDYRKAVNQEGKGYRLGATGPDFFERTAVNGRVATHVAFWAGDNTLYHAFLPDTPIGFTSYSSYFSSRFIGAHRVLGVETVANG